LSVFLLKFVCLAILLGIAHNSSTLG